MKKALLLGLALGAMASAAISFAATASASGTEASASGQKTWAKFSGAHVYKPSTLFFGAHEEIDNVHWSKWGKKLARGTGTYQVNDCLPDCADGTIRPTPASIVLTGRERCGKRFVFSRLKVYFAGHKRTSVPFCKH
jgi:hypothetical protein